MKRILVVLALAAMLLPGCGKKEEGTASGGEAAPDFELNDINTGAKVSLSSLKGSVVLLDFWATWCPPCRAEIPELVALQDQYRDKGLRVLGVSVDQGDPAMVKAFTVQYKMNYLIVNDRTAEVTQKFGGIRAIPTAVLIGRDGVILSTNVGYQSREDIEKSIVSALGG